MEKIIVSTGRGGTVKTTFVALAARYLESLFLLIDFDPDQNLADILKAASQSGNVYAIVGGMHGFSKFELFKDLELICPAHKAQIK